MSLLKKIIGGVTVDPIEAIGGVVTDIFGTKDGKMTHAEFMAELAARPHLAQAAINQIEAQHRSVFVAGWRPFIGWVCGLGLAYAFLVEPLLFRLLPELQPPVLPMAYINELIWGLLGLGGLRTVEKLQGRSR